VLKTIDIFIDDSGGIEIGNFSDERIYHFRTRLCFIRLRGSTGQERLGVEIYENNEEEPYAVTYCDNLHMERDIFNLCSYGVFLSRKDVSNIVQHIKGNYSKMAVAADETARTLAVDLPELVRYLCGYIVEQNIAAVTVGNTELYNIGVNTFGAIIKKSRFGFYPQNEIRRTLRDSGYTHCAAGRLENTVANTGKVVSLYAAKSEVIEIMKELLLEQMSERVYGKA
jgi:hypothetical protein